MIKIILIELLLLVSSVLVFRSLWTWLDKIQWLHSDWGLSLSLLVGLIGTVIAIRFLNKCAGMKNH